MSPEETTREDVEALRAELETLRQSEARFRRLVEHAVDGFFLIDPDGRIVDVNRRATEALGYSREELLSMTVPDVDLRMTHEQVAEILQRIVPGKSLTVEGIHRRKDGTTLPVEVRIGAFEEGECKLRIALARDITERKEAEVALRRSEERLASVLRSAMDAIIIVGADRRISMFNEAAEKVFRCPAAEAIGRPFASFLSPRFRDALSDCLRAFEDEGISQRYLWAPDGLTAVRADGEEFPVEATISRVEVAGQELCTIILRDINERQRAEAMLRKLQSEKVYLQEELKTVQSVGEMVGSSAAIRAVFEDIERVAATDTTVLITGETGTGKELVAEAIHDASARKDEVLVKLNCSALPPGLVESELFGHEKGAFTGAVTQKIGRFELADGGTVFLDEIGDVTLALQPKLLRVLEHGEFQRVGGSRTKKVDVRLIAATNRDLEREIQGGRFRSDLYYRLNVFPIRVPALRDRKEDIPLLARHFLDRYAVVLGKLIGSIPEAAMDGLLAYDWPGNVRELENVIERAVILTQGPELELGTWLAEPGPRSSQILTLAELEREHIRRVLELTGWRVRGKGGAARLLGLKPTTLEARMKKLGIKRERAQRGV